MRGFQACRLGCVLFLCVSARAQVQVEYPAPLSPSPSCAALPFGCLPVYTPVPGYTFVQTIPAAHLDPAHPRIDEIAFAPCQSGVWSGAILIGIGHLPANLPDPMIFPFQAWMPPYGWMTGSFRDFSIVWSPFRDGLLAWTVEQDTWSPMGLRAKGGTGFVWDGVHDVGIYISHINAITQPGTFTGLFHAEGSGGARFAFGFTAWSSTTAAIQNVKTRLTCVAADQIVAPMVLDLSVPAGGGVAISLDRVPLTATHGWTVVSTSLALPPGFGPVLGFTPDAMTFGLMLAQPQPVPGSLLHWTHPAPGLYPAAPFLIPQTVTGFLAGTELDFMAIVLDGSLRITAASNVVRHAFP